jgi:SurA N-terminal domain
MIGTIRKHSTWLWFVIIAAVIISFVWYFNPSQRMNRGGGVNEDFGSIYGKKITRDSYLEARREFSIFYFFHYGEWPEKNTSLSATDLDREIYVRMMLVQKAADLGIYISDESAASAAAQMLGSLGRNGQTVPEGEFVKQALTPEGLNAADFENFARHDLVIQQLVQTLGFAGALVTPQEAAVIYERDHREISAQIVFFSASNYLAQVATTPETVSQFYTNYLAAYRLPDRVQVNYVVFDVSNYLAKATTELTNLNELAENFYRQRGAEAFPDAKTPDEAKAKIREEAVRERALSDARVQANEFANAVFNQDPPHAEHLVEVAKEKGLAVHATAPFGSQYGPEEFTAPTAFTKAAFAMTPDEPFAGPIPSANAVYVIALARQLPTEIPPLVEIRNRVTQDYQIREATLIAQRAGTNFVRTLALQEAGGKSFAAICAAAGLQPQTLPPFSLGTQKLPELGDHADVLTQLKQASFSTPTGHTSNFEQTDDGGFVVHVQSRLPVDQSSMNSELPKFTNDLRRERENDAFNAWLQAEANRELQKTPVYQKMTDGAKPQ